MGESRPSTREWRGGGSLAISMLPCITSLQFLHKRLQALVIGACKGRQAKEGYCLSKAGHVLTGHHLLQKRTESNASMPVGRQLQLRTARMDVPRLLSTDCACTSMMPTLQEPHSAFHRLSRCGKRVACPLLLWFCQTDRKKSVVPRPSSSAGAARPSTRSQESPASWPRESVGGSAGTHLLGISSWTSCRAGPDRS